MGNLEEILKDSKEKETEVTASNVLPAGDYIATIKKTELFETKKSVDGSHLAIKIVFEVIEGKFKGHRLYLNLNIKNPSFKAQEIAVKTIHNISKACNILNIKDSKELINKVLVCSVVVETDDYRGQGAKKNEIKGFKQYEPIPY